MSRTTLQNTLTELAALLADTDGNPVASLTATGVAKVYAYEPGAEGVIKPCAVTIFPHLVTPTEWVITLRVYVADVNGPVAQDYLLDTAAALDALLKTGGGYWPSNWEFGWSPDLGCWLAQAEVMVGREDGF